MTNISLKNKTIEPGAIWLDTDGVPIQAHSGCIIYHNGLYYWYGEDKDGDTLAPDFVNYDFHRVDIKGIRCYASKDLVSWENQGLVLPPVLNNPDHDLHPSKIAERPKVIYNSNTKQFVMWLHLDNSNYGQAFVGRAVSSSPTGPFIYLGGFRPNGQESRDFTVFRDDNEKAYLVYASENNFTLHLTELTPDYLDVETAYTRLFPGMKREAPVVFKRNGTYYLITSGCTGWDPNAADVATAPSINGPWTALGNPCRGPNSDITFGAQSSFVIPVQEREGCFIMCMDAHRKENLRDSRYVWLPILFEGDTLTIPWQNRWSL